MQQALPTGFVRFLNEEELKCFDPQKITERSELGYICEVDLEYPTYLHDSHNCYPLSPEHKEIEEDLSPYVGVFGETFTEIKQNLKQRN